jgi:hypothetical protein
LTPYRLGDGRGGEAVLAAVGGEVEADAGGAVLGVGLKFMFHVGDRAGGVAAVQLERTVAVLATELGVAVDKGVGERLELPEGLIPPRGADAATLHFTLV